MLAGLFAAACTELPERPGGVQPTLGSVPERPTLRYTATEEEAVRRSLNDDRAATQYRGEVDRYRLGTSDVVPVEPPAPVLPPQTQLAATEQDDVTPPDPTIITVDDRTAGRGILELETTESDDLTSLETLASVYGVGRQVGLTRVASAEDLAGLVAREQYGRLVYTAVFPPRASTLSDGELARLDLVIREFGRTVDWSLLAEGGDVILATARAGTIRQQLLDGNVPESAITILPVPERDVDLVEIRIRR